MRVVAVACASLLAWGCIVPDGGAGPESKMAADLARMTGDLSMSAGGGRETYSTTVVGGAADILHWLPEVPLWGGDLRGRTLELAIDDSPAVTESWGYDDAGNLVRLNLTSYDVRVGDDLDGHLAVEDCCAAGMLFGRGERDYELTIAFNEDGSAVVYVDAPTW